MIPFLDGSVSDLPAKYSCVFYLSQCSVQKSFLSELRISSDLSAVEICDNGK